MEHVFSSGITQVTASKSFLPLGMSVAAVFKVPLPCCDIQLHVICSSWGICVVGVFGVFGCFEWAFFCGCSIVVDSG